MPRVQTVEKSRKELTDSITGKVIPVGSKYYWWKFRYGGRRASVQYPNRRHLTQSSFLQQLFGIEDAIGSLEASESIVDDLSSIISDIEALKDECQESLDAMPENLQESSDSGMMLQERIEGLEEWGGILEGIDTEVDEELPDKEKQELNEGIK